MATVSRAVLSKWLSETTGDQIGTTMEKQCVLCCLLLWKSLLSVCPAFIVRRRALFFVLSLHVVPSPLQMEVLDAGL